MILVLRLLFSKLLDMDIDVVVEKKRRQHWTERGLYQPIGHKMKVIANALLFYLARITCYILCLYPTSTILVYFPEQKITCERRNQWACIYPNIDTCYTIGIAEYQLECLRSSSPPSDSLCGFIIQNVTFQHVRVYFHGLVLIFDTE